MIRATYLYGSKARGDHDRFSDTDLLGVTDQKTIQKPFDKFGISFHLYPYAWLEKEAAIGSLFLLHLVNEALPIFDPGKTLENLRSKFSYKETYVPEIETGSRVVLAVLGLNEEQFTPQVRKRYFWGIRTALIARAAEMRMPTFSAKSLEASSGIEGIALHIQTRWDASLSECKRFGTRVVDQLGMSEISRADSPSGNFDFLIGQGGAAAAAASDILYGVTPK